MTSNCLGSEVQSSQNKHYYMAQIWLKNLPYIFTSPLRILHFMSCLYDNWFLKKLIKSKTVILYYLRLPRLH